MVGMGFVEPPEQIDIPASKHPSDEHSAASSTNKLKIMLPVIPLLLQYELEFVVNDRADLLHALKRIWQEFALHERQADKNA